jgi:ABC-type transport system involved in cytochrome bd biosynthesis fused ATPase/permease subunit
MATTCALTTPPSYAKKLASFSRISCAFSCLLAKTWPWAASRSARTSPASSKQKIALGRAYMREAQLLILDEPTAALDARAEYEVFERFKELTQGKTAVLISHRFSTVRMADRILVIEHGRVQEIGAHEELLARQGRYAELFQLQAAGYR